MPFPRAVKAGEHGGARGKRKGPLRVHYRAAKSGERSFPPSFSDTVRHFILLFIRRTTVTVSELVNVMGIRDHTHGR